MGGYWVRGGTHKILKNIFLEKEKFSIDENNKNTVIYDNYAGQFEILITIYMEMVFCLLKINHIDTIIETGFDWLITPQKIAVRAYTMTFLYLFGLEKNWIHPELKHLIETKIIHETNKRINKK